MPFPAGQSPAQFSLAAAMSARWLVSAASSQKCGLSRCLEVRPPPSLTALVFPALPALAGVLGRNQSGDRPVVELLL